MRDGGDLMLCVIFCYAFLGLSLSLMGPPEIRSSRNPGGF